MIRYNDKFKMRWDLIVIFLALYNCLSIPFNVAFSEMKMDEMMGIVIFERLVDVSFALDICFNFRTTFINPKTGTEVILPKRIAANYVFLGRFWVDLAASIPFEIFVSLFTAESSSNQNNITFQLFGLLKLVRLLRLGRIVSFLKVRPNFKMGMRIGQLVGALLLVVHWIGCILFLLVKNRGTWLPPKDLNA